VLRVLVGEETSLEDLRQAADDKGPGLSWIVLKAAEAGDKVVFFFSKGKEFHAHGRIKIGSIPERTLFGEKAAYRAEVDSIQMFKSPVPLDAVAEQFPEWAWVRSYTKGPTTPPGAVADELLDFLIGQDREVAVTLPEEVPTGSTYTEGSVQRILVNRYERDLEARDACIEHYKPTCVVCGFKFAAVYGSLAHGYTHVRHLMPLAEIAEQYAVDPIADLRSSTWAVNVVALTRLEILSIHASWLFGNHSVVSDEATRGVAIVNGVSSICQSCRGCRERLGRHIEIVRPFPGGMAIGGL